MGTLNLTLAGLAFGFLALMLGTQALIRRRVRALEGAPVPPLPGAVGSRITAAGHSLVYFFSPTCGACRTITPRVRALEQHHSGVFAIDVSRELELAQALSVMATPSTVEISGGVLTGYHVGPIPEAVLARFR